MFVATADSNESEASIQTSTSTLSMLGWSEPCRSFEFDEILSATHNFDESLVIGSGGFGKVYKGNVFNGSTSVVVAIKRLDSTSNQGASEFWAEVEMLFRLRHCHLVSLIGYCNYQKELILVYEYMPNGTLYDHLHKLNTRLSWLQRLKICIGAARGLDYLHTGTGIEFGITHRDVKSLNILLNESWAAKISDFGLSKLVPKDQQSSYVNTLVKGSFGYLDPYYVSTGKLSRESDVYAFGVILFEVLCRKSAVDGNVDWGIVTWAQESIKEGRLKSIIDSYIRDEIYPKCLKWFVRIAERCLDNHPRHRPTMNEVVFTLESVLNLQEKTNDLLQAVGKTTFGRMVDMFSFTTKGDNSGMEFGFLMLMKRKLFMFREKIFQQSGALVFKDKVKTNCFGSIKVFQAKELEKATQNFAGNNVVGIGGYGSMYKGVLPDNRVVAIKIHRMSGEEQLEQFINEVVILETLNHENVVQFLGCCLENNVAFLVYEFVNNRTLHHHIHYETSDDVRLSWDSRLRIAHESSGALAYLHTYIIHRDVKSANIFLDENYTAKVSDFGASSLFLLDQDQDQVTTQVQGTLGYIDPEYFQTGQPTDKSDVYSFGVVLAELLTTKKPIDWWRDENRYLASDFVEANRENRLREIVDPQVLEEATEEQLTATCDLVCRCLELSGGNRPTMKEVTMELESLRKLGKHPWFVEDNYRESGHLTSESEQVDHDDASLPAYS